MYQSTYENYIFADTVTDQGTTPLLSKYWMPLEPFTKDAMAGLCRGDVLIGVGDAQDKLDKWESGKLEAISRTMPTPD